jgi:hypothetical protein
VIQLEGPVQVLVPVLSQGHHAHIVLCEHPAVHTQSSSLLLHRLRPLYTLRFPHPPLASCQHVSYQHVSYQHVFCQRPADYLSSYLFPQSSGFTLFPILEVFSITIFTMTDRTISLHRQHGSQIFIDKGSFS